MKYYPIFMDIKDRECLVVGAGPVGARKALGLLRAGAKVIVVSPGMTPKMDAARQKGAICLERPYEPADVRDKALVFAATSDSDLNRRILADAQDRGIFCNVADAPSASDFILPSVVERGDLILAVSTSGNSPALARTIKQQLEAAFGPEYETILRVFGRIRQGLLAGEHDPDSHRAIFYDLIEQDLPGMIRDNDENAINALLRDTLGPGYRYKDLVL